MTDEDETAPPPKEWQRFEMSNLRDRLAQVRNLLRQASAVGLAQDVSRMETLMDLHEKGNRSGDKRRRRYR